MEVGFQMNSEFVRVRELMYKCEVRCVYVYKSGTNDYVYVQVIGPPLE